MAHRNNVGSKHTDIRYGKPIEDGEPSLPRDELKAQMLVEAL